uniref:Ig-like domain-containing protein n=1 Tax=Denticeps clupeoides TaxID=299321 RepID=A0AAY4DHB8_9TELE
RKQSIVCVTVELNCSWKNDVYVLQCEAKGFTPPQIFFSWKWAGEVVEPLRPPSDISHTAEGLYQAVSNLTITPAIKDRNVTVSCMVLHIGLRRPLKVEFQPSFVSE